MKKLAEKLEALAEWGGLRKDVVCLVISGAALVASMVGGVPLPFDVAWVAIVLCGIPILLEAEMGLIIAFDVKADVLVSMALIASVCIGEDFAAGEVAFIMQLGALLEDLTVAKARAGIERLVHLTPRTARVLDGGGERIVPAEQVRVGDRIRVLPGETVPVDGVILSGSTSIDQAVMTGESMPVDKAADDEVSSGTVNRFGAFEMEAVRVGEDSAFQRMIRLVQSADAGKAKIVGIADQWATWIVVIALTAAALTWLISGEIIRAVTILVVFCPCALVLATPTAIMAAIGNATRHGFLVREGDALERLAGVTEVAFDKTGTLTCGVPGVAAVVSTSEFSRGELYALTAAAEHLSEHPLGRAIVRGYQAENGDALPEAREFRMIPGEGVEATVGVRRILAGNRKLTGGAAHSEAEAYLNDGCTMIFVVVDGASAGFIALGDTVRGESAAVIQSLQAQDIRTVLLTGDNRSAAAVIAGKVGIGEVCADCLPEDKLAAIGERQAGGAKVCMVGDGVNDAPALKRADVGIAMGGIGSDIAVDAADIALVNDEISELPHLIALSRRMMSVIRANLTFSMGLNFLAIVLAIAGALGPVIGALVILNSALLLGWRRRQ